MRNALFFCSILALAACEAGSPANQTEQAPSEPIVETVTETPALNVDSVVFVINELRSTLEADTAAGMEVNTAEMREKTKQKWEKIHFYTSNGSLGRVKTYPHAGVSSRTEEFYFHDGQLALVVIEDDGSGERGNESPDKMYYFHNEELIKETRSNEEAEFAIRESDAEELLSEAREYAAAFKAMQ